MDQAHSSQIRQDFTDFSFVNTACLTQIAADMDYAQSLPEPIIEPKECHCQMCLCTLQDNQSRTELQPENFRLQTQPKLKIVEQKLNKCRARLATVILFQLPVTLRLTTLFHTSYCLPHTSYCLPPVSVACYIPLLPRPTSCIYRGLSAIQNKQSSHTAYPVQQQER